MNIEVIVGCLSRHHRLIYCEKCIFAFGEKACWDYRDRYKPRLIEKEYWEKFNELDPRREPVVEVHDRVSQLQKSDD